MTSAQDRERAEQTLFMETIEREVCEQLGFPSRPIKAEGVVLAAIWALLLRARRDLEAARCEGCRSPAPSSRNLAATYIWEVNLLPPNGDRYKDWQEFLFACGTIGEAKQLAFNLHPDWTVGTIESFVTRQVWTKR